MIKTKRYLISGYNETINFNENYDINDCEITIDAINCDIEIKLSYVLTKIIILGENNRLKIPSVYAINHSVYYLVIDIFGKNNYVETKNIVKNVKIMSNDNTIICNNISNIYFLSTEFHEIFEYGINNNKIIINGDTPNAVVSFNTMRPNSYNNILSIENNDNNITTFYNDTELPSNKDRLYINLFSDNIDSQIIARNSKIYLSEKVYIL